jgi:hypothetical protein
MAEQCPFELAYDAFWDALEESAVFLALFPHGTRKQVRYSADGANEKAPDPDIEYPASADYPRCQVVLNGLEPTVNHDTSNSTFKMRLGIEIGTGQQMQGLLLRCLWALCCGSANWTEKMRETVTWKGYKIVTAVSLAPASTPLDNEKLNRGTKQWVSVGEAVVALAVKTEDIKTL